MKKLRKANYSIAAALMVMATFASVPFVAAYSGSGVGTEETPYLIATCSQFAEISDNLDAHYVLTKDIDCTSAGDTIKVLEEEFTGVLDGGNHTLTIRLTEETGYFKNLALFDSISGEVRNLKLAGSVINDDDSAEGYSAALAVYSYGGTLSNISSTVTVTDEGDTVGGLVASIVNGTADNIHVSAPLTGASVGGVAAFAACGSTVTNSSYAGTITATNRSGGIAVSDGCEGPGGTFKNVTTSGVINASGADIVGGIIGESMDGSVSGASSSMTIHGRNEVGGLIGSAGRYSIERSRASGAVNASGDDVGGLVGRTWGDAGSITKSYATGNVTTEGSRVGGFIGAAEQVTIQDSYARGSVVGKNYVGGFVGTYISEGIGRSYATGAVDSSIAPYGGFAGSAEDTGISRSFWDRQTSGASDIEMSWPLGLSKTTTEMKTQTTYAMPADEDAWDFDTVWMIGDENNGYPCLQWDSVCRGEGPVADDNDGIAAAIEDAAPNGGDANADGIKDSEQSNVASFVHPVSNTYSVVEIADTCSLINVSGDSENDASSDVAYDYKTGLIAFSAECEAESVLVKVYQFGIKRDSLVLRKFIPASGNYFTIDGAAITEQVIGGESAVVAAYTIIDNGELDLNPAVGMITDPVGLASQSVGAPNTGLHRSMTSNPIVSIALIVTSITLLGVGAYRMNKTSLYSRKVRS